jgi:thiol:disulfide interchange protein DsbA
VVELTVQLSALQRLRADVRRLEQKQAKDVAVRALPITFRPDFEPQQLYYVLESLGKVDELHKGVYGVHVDGQPLSTADQVSAWVDKRELPERSSWSCTTRSPSPPGTQSHPAAGRLCAGRRSALGINDRYSPLCAGQDGWSLSCRLPTP